MKDIDIADPLFSQAVAAIDSGKIAELEDLVIRHPVLVKERLRGSGQGYFKDPYLLWFVADNPVRTDKLPSNIVEITRVLVQAVGREASDTYQSQIDYTLGLVASGSIARECGVQIPLIDILIDAGASPGDGLDALANGNVEAARHLIDRSGKLTLASAVCLGRMDDIDLLISTASADEKLTALTAAAFYGKANMVRRLLESGTGPNGYADPDSGFHSHGTALHQAVSSGSLESVKLLVGAGASLDEPDKIYNGTPLEWSVYMQSVDSFDESAKRRFALIESYLRSFEQKQ